MVNKSVVTWSDHSAFLLSGLRDLLATGQNSDLEIKCSNGDGSNGGGDRSFRVHRLVVNLFTDFFKSCDGLWVRVNADADHVENLIKFFYLGQVTVDYSSMEGFLLTCKLLGVRLFKGVEAKGPRGCRGGTAETSAGSAATSATSPTKNNIEIDEEDVWQPRYELDDFQLVCRNCYKCFPDDKGLKKHTWGCTRNAVFACNLCDRRFRNELQSHEFTHTGERPFKCTADGCTRAFRLKNAYVNHVKVENIRYKCDHCEMDFKSKIGRKSHMESTHPTGRPLACKDCSKTFKTSQLLYSHQKNAHKVNRKYFTAAGAPVSSGGS